MLHEIVCVGWGGRYRIERQVLTIHTYILVEEHVQKLNV